MKLIPLENGAVEIADIDISKLTGSDYEQIRTILRKESVILIREQTTKSLEYAKLIQAVSKGEIRNWKDFAWDGEGNPIEVLIKSGKYPDPFKWDENVPYPVERVTGEKRKNELTGIFPTGVLDWHCNLNHPTSADGVSLQAISEGTRNTRTSFLNTALAYKHMPNDLKQRIQNVYCEYTFNIQNWALMDNPDQKAYSETIRAPYAMWLVQKNIIGIEGVYFHFLNDAKIITEDETLYSDLKEYLFQEKFMYHHDWEIGDIILMDQLLSLHKRRLEEDDVFRKRLLHRYTFRITGYGSPNKILEQNDFEVNHTTMKEFRQNISEKYYESKK